jgi:hypothetical protein
MVAVLLMILALAPAQGSAGVPGLWRQGDAGGPPGQVAEASQAALLRVLEDADAESAAKILALEQLAYRGRAPLPYDTIRRTRRLVRGEHLADWLRCLGMCGEQGLQDLRDLPEQRRGMMQAEIVYALGRRDSAGEDLARATLADRSRPAEVRVAALRALADRGSPFAEVEALRRLAMEDGPLLLEALAVLHRAPTADHIPFLIDLLAEREGRPAAEAAALLRRITGYGIGTDERTWRLHYLRHKAEGTPFRLVSDQDAGSVETLSYLGIPLLSDRIVFVLDSSGSMDDALPERRGRTRGAVAVGEFSAMLPRLPASASFNIAFFDGGVRSWAPRLQAQDDRTVGDARGWVQANAFEGGTNLFGGVAFAFVDPDVEELVLLSDGMPSEGELTDPAAILARVARWNRWRLMRISTISFGAPPHARAFLFRLAHEQGGAFRLID